MLFLRIFSSKNYISQKVRTNSSYRIIFLPLNLHKNETIFTKKRAKRQFLSIKKITKIHAKKQ